MRITALAIIIIFCTIVVHAQKVTIHAADEPAAEVFRSLIEQTGKNFVYPSEILNDMRVSVEAENRPLKAVLDMMFRGTDIEYRIKGRNVVLRRRTKVSRIVNSAPKISTSASPKSTELDELLVVSRLEAPAVETTEIGAKKVTAEEVRHAPALLGESDVIKALQLQPGIADGTEGLAGMYVHGGNADQNLYMLDNVPLYQVNHFAGLFSAFNTDIIRYIDFYKSSVPAKYDGRLSSFMDVRLQNGNSEGHHGSGRLGLTSGAFNISGPIGDKTTYLAGIRRSWYDVLTIPGLALLNKNSTEKIRFHYYFMDLNAKVTHRLNDKMSIFASVYFGDDLLRTGYQDEWYDKTEDKETYDFHWGNLVAQTGMNYRIKPSLKAEFTAAYTRFFSSMKHTAESDWTGIETTESMKTENNINDWIFRGDFTWDAGDKTKLRFGANYTRHTFKPSQTSRSYRTAGMALDARDSAMTYGANEVNAYIEGSVQAGSKVSLNAGLHASIFDISGKVKHGLSPRLSASWRAGENVAVKAAYTRTTQYVHQLSQTYLALPTDQWIPITGNFKPETADKISAGVYWQSDDRQFAASIEGYYKWMNNLIEYADEYYLRPPADIWNARLASGRGTARGFDFKIEKHFGKFTGHIAYSLAWSDRTFADKNGGRPYPARFDNRHSIKLAVNWKVSRRVELNAAWVGHSGNRFTFMPQMWECPPGLVGFGNHDAPLKVSVNNYQLPFYHRLDLSCMVRNSRGYWTFGLYNAYCHMNTIALRRSYRDVKIETPTGTSYNSYPVFQKVSLLPIIPSISYTWEF